MATCKDCFHFEVCDSGRHIGEYELDDGVYSEGVENECLTFKPTADVVEVKHGEWLKPLGDNGSGWNCGGVIKQILGCSCCGHFYQNAPYNYCPNCGAKMDE